MGRRPPAAIAQWTDAYGPAFASRLGFSRLERPTASVPSELLPRIDVAALEAVPRAGIAAPSPPATDPARRGAAPPDPRVVNIDGTCPRGRARRSAGPPGVHLPAAFAPRLRAVLVQLRADAKTDGHEAALEVLDVLPRRPGGHIFAGDAIGTQAEVCQAIRNRGDDDVLVVQDDQPALSHPALRRRFLMPHLAYAFFNSAKCLLGDAGR